MKTNDLDNLWHSLKPRHDNNREVVTKLIEIEQKKQRNRRLVFANMGVNLLVFSGLFIWALVTERSSLAQAWPVLLTLLILWATYIEILRYRVQNRASYQESIRSVISVSLGRIQVALRETRILLGITVCAIIPLLLMSLSNLLTGGFMNAREAISYSAFSSAILALNLFVVGYLRNRKFKPRMQLLQGRLDAINAPK